MAQSDLEAAPSRDPADGEGTSKEEESKFRELFPVFVSALWTAIGKGGPPDSTRVKSFPEAGELRLVRDMLPALTALSGNEACAGCFWNNTFVIASLKGFSEGFQEQLGSLFKAVANRDEDAVAEVIFRLFQGRLESALAEVRRIWGRDLDEVFLSSIRVENRVHVSGDKIPSLKAASNIERTLTLALEGYKRSTKTKYLDLYNSMMSKVKQVPVLDTIYTLREARWKVDFLPETAEVEFRRDKLEQDFSALGLGLFYEKHVAPAIPSNGILKLRSCLHPDMAVARFLTERMKAGECYDPAVVVSWPPACAYCGLALADLAAVHGVEMQFEKESNYLRPHWKLMKDEHSEGFARDVVLTFVTALGDYGVQPEGFKTVSCALLKWYLTR